MIESDLYIIFGVGQMFFCRFFHNNSGSGDVENDWKRHACYHITHRAATQQLWLPMQQPFSAGKKSSARCLDAGGGGGGGGVD